ncbi:MAG TPA: aldehyde dehydrogenase family protein [Vicinamibacterales bacterium]|nr:aldehyde dehydrogenase family protein [Vicinamibacterales bacterium]
MPSAAQTDRDLASISEARTLARRARQAQLILAEFSQQQIDAIIDAMAAAVTPFAESLARLAVEETTYGVVADKIQKNLFGSKQVYEFIRPMKTVGVINRIEDKKIVEIAEPFGVVAAIVPSTNPTSTTIYKILISIKARCAIVISPHPSAARSIIRTAEIMYDAARKAGLPEGAIGWLTTVTLEGTQELMKQREISVILATGGMGLVRAAYSAGKPAYGVGPGNAPCYIEQSADLTKAAADILTGKAFDNGVLCSSPNSVVVDAAVDGEVRRQFQAQGGHFLSASEADTLAAILVTPQRLPNPALVGKSAIYIAEKIGISVPPGTRALIAELKGVGRDHPLSIEKLCPVLSYYVVQDWKEACERCKQILRYGGMGHTMSIHSRNEQVILEFGLHKPAYRICVNTPSTLGAIGLTTGLDPAMTLGCGGFGGNITSDNITPRHLLNIKRLAYEIRPVNAAGGQAGAGPGRQVMAGGQVTAGGQVGEPKLPQAPAKPVPEPIAADNLTRRIDAFLSSRGLAGAPSPPSATPATSAVNPPALPGPPAHLLTPPAQPVAAFVCEDDVRTAVKQGQKIVVGEKTIITPSGRDAGEAAKVFIWQSYPA